MHKSVLLAALSATLCVPAAQGQWAFSGSDIFNTNPGFVGIGTTTPNVDLTVVGTGSFQDPADPNAQVFIGTVKSSRYSFLLPFDFATGTWLNTVLNAGGGSVGIGTFFPDPAYKLSVNGGIRAKEIVVETGWADFVFAPDYRLPPLAEVESYIADHGHLPEIPSAAEVDAEGVGLGAMQVKLLQKIEELTLYLIEQDKKIARLEAGNGRRNPAAGGE